MHSHNEECDEKVEDFTSDDVLVNPDDPLRTGDHLQVLDPAVNHTEGVVESPKRAALHGGGEATERDQAGGVFYYLLTRFRCFQALNVKLIIMIVKKNKCLRFHTSRQSTPRWTELQQRRGRRGARLKWFASGLLYPSAGGAGSSGSG